MSMEFPRLLLRIRRKDIAISRRCSFQSNLSSGLVITRIPGLAASALVELSGNLVITANLWSVSAQEGLVAVKSNFK